MLSHERSDIGVPTYRTYVQYIPQRPSLLPGTPRDLFETLSTFHARLTPGHSSEGHGHFNRAAILAEQWGIARELWDRPWSLLSGGESQRLSLAIAYGFHRAEVLLLDGAYLFFWSIATRFHLPQFLSTREFVRTDIRT